MSEQIQSRRVSPLGAGLLLLLTLAAGLAASATPAAATGPIIQVMETSGSDLSAKSKVATCPPAHPKLVGTGGGITNGGGRVVIDDIIPNLVAGTVTVWGRPVAGGATADWSVTAVAICTNLNIGLSLATAVDATSATTKIPTAWCPAGQKAVGTGFSLNGALGRVGVDTVVPTPTLGGVVVAARPTPDGPQGAWSATAYAICTPGNLVTLAREASTSASNSSNKWWGESCPAQYGLLGVGAQVNNGGGAVLLDALVSDVEMIPPGTATIAQEYKTGTSASWSLTAFAICIAPAEG